MVFNIYMFTEVEIDVVVSPEVFVLMTVFTGLFFMYCSFSIFHTVENTKVEFQTLNNRKGHGEIRIFYETIESNSSREDAL